jgi:hypothetical protein
MEVLFELLAIMELFQEKIVGVVAPFSEGVFFRTLESGIVAASSALLTLLDFLKLVLRHIF